MNTITENSEVLTVICSIIVGGIWRAIEKRRLRKKGVLNDKEIVKDKEEAI